MKHVRYQKRWRIPSFLIRWEGKMHAMDTGLRVEKMKEGKWKRKDAIHGKVKKIRTKKWYQQGTFIFLKGKGNLCTELNTAVRSCCYPSPFQIILPVLFVIRHTGYININFFIMTFEELWWCDMRQHRKLPGHTEEFQSSLVSHLFNKDGRLIGK